MAVTDVPLALHRGESDVHTARSYLDETGNVTMVIDAALIRDVYLRACEGQGLGRPSVIGSEGIRHCRASGNTSSKTAKTVKTA